MFNDELVSSMTNTIVNLGDRVDELERKETLTAGDHIGPFRHEIHVDINGQGQFSSIKTACDFVAAQGSVGSIEWLLWIHPGDYDEEPFTIPEFTALWGIGGDVNISPANEPLEEDFITVLDGGVTLRNLQIRALVAPGAQDVFLLNSSGSGLVLDRCLFLATVQNTGVNEMGAVKCTAPGFSFFGCEFTVSNSNDGIQYVLYLDVGNNRTDNYIRSCRIWRSSTNVSVGVHFAGIDSELYILETTILPEDVDIFADTSAIVYLRGTEYLTGDGGGTITYMYAAGAGTVTSVALDAPADVFDVAGSPIVGAGTLALSFVDQAANTVFAGPDSGVDDIPTFRALVEDDIPLLSPDKIDGDVVLGTGAVDKVARWTAVDTISTGLLYDNNSQIWAYTTAPKGFAGFTLAEGSANDGSGPAAQIAFEFEGASGGGYSHFIKSRHNVGDVANNAIDFYLNYGATAAQSTSPGVFNRRILILDTVNGATIGDPLGTARNLTVTGDLVVNGSISATFSNLRTGTGAGNTLELQAYDVDGAAYVTFATLTANNSPTMDLADTVTKAGGYIYRAGGTEVPITDGGTGASTAADARTNLGLNSGGAGDIWVNVTGDTMSGNLLIQKATATLTVEATGSTNATMVFDSPAGNQSQLNFNSSGTARWIFLKNNTAESGSNAGSDFALLRRTDAGGSLGTPIFIERATGFIGINRTTAAALYTLDVSGTFRVDATTGGIATLYRTDTSASANDVIGCLEFANNDTQLTTQNVYGNIEVQAQAAIASDAAFGKMLFRTTGVGAGTLPVERLTLGCVKTLTDAATNLFDVTLNSGEMAGGTVVWTIIASDGTDHQAYSGIVTYAVVNKAGAYTTQITHNTGNDSKAVSSGTLTATWSILNGTNKVTIRVTPSGSLTETTYRIIYSVHSNSPQSTTIL